MNSVIQWLDDNGQQLLPTGIGQVLYLACETIEEVIETGLAKKAPAGTIGMVGKQRTAVLLEDGWHWVGSVLVDHDKKPEETITNWRGDVLAHDDGLVTMDITLTDVDPDVIELLTGVGVGEAHAEATWSETDGEWSCTACGAVSGDTGLFNEVGCSVR